AFLATLSPSLSEAGSSTVAVAGLVVSSGFFSSVLATASVAAGCNTPSTRPKRLALWKLPCPRIGDQATPLLSFMAYRFMRHLLPVSGGTFLALSNEDQGSLISTVYPSSLSLGLSIVPWTWTALSRLLLQSSCPKGPSGLVFGLL